MATIAIGVGLLLVAAWSAAWIGVAWAIVAMGLVVAGIIAGSRILAARNRDAGRNSLDLEAPAPEAQ